MSDADRLDAHLDALPIFPLPTAVLLPYEVLPLHIFEPRYREMVAEALAHERPLAIAQLAPGWEGDYEGRPAVETLCGVGVITNHERLPDGRYNILLKGVARIEIVRELPPRFQFREVQARRVHDTRTAAPHEQVVEAMEDVRRMLFALCAARPGPASNTLAHLATSAADASALADIVAAALFTEFSRRKQALTTLDPVERLSLVQTAVAELLVGEPESEEIRYLN